MLSSLFPLTLFMSALLLFSIQPMVAKALLPIYGGSPSVWTVCMLFFQIMILLAYAYAWILAILKKQSIMRSIHIFLILSSLVAMPLLFHPISTEGLPEWSILYNLLTQLGLPMLVLGACAPLLQFTYSQTSERSASDPYFLYVSSNLGSLVSLFLYPWVIERLLNLSKQFYLWSIFYCIYLVLMLIILFKVTYKEQINPTKISELPWKNLVLWVFLAFIPCSLMLGVTLYITTDIAATPLFWILPLALYLLSFAITFSSKPLIPHQWVVQNSVFFLIFTVIGFILSPIQMKAWQIILFNLLSFFILALLCHRELYLARPKPQELNIFYFCLALGGVLAGLFNGVVARHLFNQVYEYPLAILLSLLVIPLPKKKGGIWIVLTVVVLLISSYYFKPDISEFFGLNFSQIIALITLMIIVLWQQNKSTLFFSMACLFLFLFLPSLRWNGLLLQERSFYAVNRVFNQNGIHVFLSQSTVHGLQDMHERRPNGFHSYYGGIKSVIDTLKTEFHPLTVTIMGLGIGTMACQFRKNDKVNFIEIDQQVIDIAKNSALFTYLRDCPALDIIKKDGRLAMDQLPDASQRLLVLDAFNSDAIPVHLMTLEAFRLYKRKLSRDGVILVNLSNRHLDLLPVMNALAHSLNFMIFYLDHKGDKKLGQFDSNWVLLTTNQYLVPKLLTKTENWHFAAETRQFLWTDNYSNIIPLMKWQ